jgi:CheY-like chemotaxis protein
VKDRCCLFTLGGLPEFIVTFGEFFESHCCIERFREISSVRLHLAICVFMSNPTRKALRVLVVDDFRALADHVVQLLARTGYDACAAYDGDDALRLAEEFRPHAVVSDIYMPRMNGFELADAISRRFPACEVLLTSADSEFAMPSLEPQRFKVVPKPVLLDELFDFLAACTAVPETSPVV